MLFRHLQVSIGFLSMISEKTLWRVKKSRKESDSSCDNHGRRAYETNRKIWSTCRGNSYQNLRSIGGNRKRREGRESDFALPLSKKVHFLREQTPQIIQKLYLWRLFSPTCPPPPPKINLWLMILVRPGYLSSYVNNASPTEGRAHEQLLSYFFNLSFSRLVPLLLFL